MADQNLITVAEVADALGAPGQVSAVHEGLIADGLTIHEDWAGRPCLSLTDAKKTLARHRRQQAELQARSEKEAAERQEAHLAQVEFDQVAGRALPLLRKADPHSHSYEAEMERIREARLIALETVKAKYSADAVAKITLRPIITIEDDATNNMRLFPVVDSSGLDPKAVARGSFPQRAAEALERVKSVLGAKK